MEDPRLEAIARAAEDLADGRYHVQLAIDDGDELARVARALSALSEQLAQRFRELQAMTAVTERVNAGLLLEEVCEHVFEAFRGLLPYDRLGLALLQDGGRTLRAIWARSDAEEVLLKVGYAAPMAGSSLERVLRTGKPRIINDLQAHLRTHPWSESTALVLREGVRSSLTCPLLAEGRPVGFLFFSSFRPGTYAREHVQLYQAVAGQLSVIVEKSRLYQELVELSELKNRVLGVAAHDLRNPLTLVLASLDLLGAGVGGELDPRGQELVQRASAAAERMVRLIDDLLDVSAIESGRLALRRSPLDIGPWLERRVDDQRLLAEAKQMRLELERPVEPLWVEADSTRLEQVVSNLLSNAVKYGEPGTPIRVVLSAGEREVCIQVRDQGQGIPTAELPRVFQPFARTSARPTGGESSTGLGMAISRKLVEAHGGSISVESTVGEGSSFRVCLPRTAAGGATASPSGSA